MFYMRQDKFLKNLGFFCFNLLSIRQVFPISENVYSRYRKIPKISPGAYIFQRPFLRGLFLEGLVFGGAYLWREICVSKSIGQAV